MRGSQHPLLSPRASEGCDMRAPNFYDNRLHVRMELIPRHTMLSFLFKLFRFLFVVSAVLLAGQVVVEGRTIGEHFSLLVKEGLKSTQEKLSKSTLVASLPRYFPGNQKI